MTLGCKLELTSENVKELLKASTDRSSIKLDATLIACEHDVLL